MKRFSAACTFAQARTVFERKNDACLVFIAQDTRGYVDATEFQRIVARVTDALQFSSGQAVVDELCLEPYAPILELIARDRAEASHPGSGEAAARDAQIFVHTIEGYQHAGPRRVRATSFLRGFRQLDTALVRAPRGDAQKAKWRRRHTLLLRVQHVILRRGLRSPADLPRHSVFAAWCRADGYSRQAVTQSCWAYRRARAAAGALDWPPLDPREDKTPRGIRSTEKLPERMEACAARLRADGKSCAWTPDQDLNALDTFDILAVIAPDIAVAARGYIDRARAQLLVSEGWIEAVRSSASVLVADIIRAGEDPFTLSYLKLFEEWRAVPLGGPLYARGLRDAAPGGATRHVLLIQKVVDTAAAASCALSPITLPAEQRNRPVPRYSAALRNGVYAAWAVCYGIYGEEQGRITDPTTMEAWKQMTENYNRFQLHMRQYNVSCHTSGEKEMSLLRLVYGQVVGFGLADAWQACERTEEAWKQQVALEGVGARGAAAARAEFYDALRTYALNAIVVEDGMRIRNYAGARMGVNVLMVGQRDAGGDWVRIDEITMKFCGYDRIAGTKRRKDASTKAEAKHVRIVMPGMVDHARIAQYLNLARMETLIATGRIPSRAAYDPAKDEWALFLTPHANSKKRSYGGFGEATLSKKVGQFLHHTARDLLQMKDGEGNPIPSWAELQEDSVAGLELRKKWRGIWSAHTMRHLLATFFLGVLKDPVGAMERTHDLEETLTRVYLQHESLLLTLEKRTGIYRPDFFADLCRRLIAGEILDWGSFNPHAPHDAKFL